MDYRKKYKKHYHINFSDKYEIHHIDLNHNNNDINNLLLIPKELHHRYHETLNSINFDKITLIKEIRGYTEKGNNNNWYIAEKIFEFSKIYSECQIWKDYKLYLDGEIPNIHNIEVK